MSVHREVDLLHGVLVLSRHHQLVDDLRRMGPDNVRSEDLTIFRVSNDLHEPVGLAAGARAAICREGKLPDLVLELLFLALLLGEPDRCHLWMAVRRIGDVAVIHRVRVLSGEALGERDSFARALVRKHWRTGDIANREDTLGAGTELLVDLDEAA